MFINFFLLLYLGMSLITTRWYLSRGEGPVSFQLCPSIWWTFGPRVRPITSSQEAGQRRRPSKPRNTAKSTESYLNWNPTQVSSFHLHAYMCLLICICAEFFPNWKDITRNKLTDPSEWNLCICSTVLLTTIEPKLLFFG